MTIAELGSVGEFIGSIAVLITLIYLAIQVRQNTRHVQAQMGHDGWLANTHDEIAKLGDDAAETLAKADLPITFENYPILDMHMEIATFLQQNGIQFIDLREAFTESQELPRYYASDTWHPNIKGHKFIAKQLLPLVLLD